MTSDTREVAVIVGGGPCISASCGRLFSNSGMQVALAARNPEKEAMKQLEKDFDVRLFRCDGSQVDDVRELFERIENEIV